MYNRILIMDNNIPAGILAKMGDITLRLIFIRDGDYANVYCSTCRKSSRGKIKNVLFENLRCDKCNHLIYNELEK
jgi:hypothetical protein